uniref:Uncharacterized protein n=1 Tax=Candidatus Kentrum sp. TC TaxID=2126339 RepID=A0A450YJ69_9GAMM|nr:MAG: hypothetical protein BECKTC1821E_GA0114239_101216 [Candidatus Kentron sp. TC]
MKSLKTTIIAWVLSMLVAMPALASNESVPPSATPTQFTETDIQSLFEQNAEPMPSSSPVGELAAGDVEALFEQGAEPMQLAALSPEEMAETEGAWVQFAIGGVFGGAGYAWGVYRGNYSWNTMDFVGNVATGSLIGGTFGTLGKIASGGVGFVSGLTNTWVNLGRANSFLYNGAVNKHWRR